jgi:alkylhydroperoxidase/carboxymuconolactone decarboxylase family protein YurZ
VKNDELLRRLALNDEKTVRSAIGADSATEALDSKTAALVRLAALLSVGAPTVSCRATVEAARANGASDEEIVGVLVAVGPAVGAARLVDAAPRLALAIDCDVEGLDERY